MKECVGKAKTDSLKATRKGSTGARVLVVFAFCRNPGRGVLLLFVLF